MKRLKITPQYARYYLIFAFLLIAAPTIMYKMLPSHAGMILVASPQSRDAHFARTLVYVQTHHGYGARGYILNKKLEEDKARALQTRFPFAHIDQFYEGGPIEPGDAFFFLVSKNELSSAFDIYNVKELQDSDLELYNKIITQKSLRILSGYAGWYGFQLNKEIVRGGWEVIDYSADLLEGNQDESWRKALARAVKEKNIVQPAI